MAILINTEVPKVTWKAWKTWEKEITHIMIKTSQNHEQEWIWEDMKCQIYMMNIMTKSPMKS